MSVSGKCVHRARDAWGAIEVWRDADRLYLSFDGETAQSAIDRHAPGRLVFEYTRAMLLGLLFIPDARRASLLGLGGGSLATALYHGDEAMRIEAVELRPAVAETARAWFQLPDDPRLRVRIGDALEALSACPQSADILFADLYRPGGMEPRQAEPDFLAACRRALRPGGVLVLNYWQADRLSSLALNQTLGETFGRDVLTLTVPGGNCLAFALDGGVPRIGRQRLIERARRLGKRHGVSLTKLARELYRHNHLRFRFGGY